MLKPGDIAPPFQAVDENGTSVSLSDFKNRKQVLFFYSGDDTESCTAECLGFRKAYRKFKALGYEITGISPDSVAHHKKFKTKYRFPFRLISDPQLKLMKPYGAWGEKIFFGKLVEGLHRIVVVLNEESRVTHVLTKFIARNAATAILEELKK